MPPTRGNRRFYPSFRPLQGAPRRFQLEPPTFHLERRDLLHYFRKGLRNGRWRRLRRVEQCLFLASMDLAGRRGGIVSIDLISMLAKIMLKIVRSVKADIISLGRGRAEELRRRFEEAGLFRLAPWVREWFTDREYVFYLGIVEMQGNRGF